jgi:hypothetical protein
MNILSFTHTIHDSGSAAHFKDKSNAHLADAIVQHPPGTVLDLPDDQASSLIERGFAVEWLPDEHGADPASILRVMTRPQIQISQQGVPGVRYA